MGGLSGSLWRGHRCPLRRPWFIWFIVAFTPRAPSGCGSSCERADLPRGRVGGSPSQRVLLVGTPRIPVQTPPPLAGP